MAKSGFSLAVCGDVNIQERAAPVGVFRLVRDRLADADVLLGNMEMCLSGADDVLTVKQPREGKPAWRQSDPEMVKALVDVGFDAVTTANNVTFGAGTIERSLAVLDGHGIAHTGSGENERAAREPAVVTAPDGTRIGLLGYTCPTYTRGHVATPDEAGVAAVRCRAAYEPSHRAPEMPGVAPIVRSWPESEDLAKAVRDVEGLRSQVDVVVVYVHMGVSSQAELTEYQPLVARSMVDAGADLVFGASAHVPQAVEMYRQVPIFYGLGNFAFDWWFMQDKPVGLDMRDGLLVQCDVVEGRVVRVGFRPVSRTRDEENLVQVLSIDSERGAAIINQVIGLSAEFSTTFQPDPDRDIVMVHDTTS